MFGLSLIDASHRHHDITKQAPPQRIHRGISLASFVGSFIVRIKWVIGTEITASPLHARRYRSAPYFQENLPTPAVPVRQHKFLGSPLVIAYGRDVVTNCTLRPLSCENCLQIFPNDC
jgi:hypothetical protein